MDSIAYTFSSVDFLHGVCRFISTNDARGVCEQETFCVCQYWTHHLCRMRLQLLLFLACRLQLQDLPWYLYISTVNNEPGISAVWFWCIGMLDSRHGTFNRKAPYATTGTVHISSVLFTGFSTRYCISLEFWCWFILLFWSGFLQVGFLFQKIMRFTLVCRSWYHAPYSN